MHVLGGAGHGGAAVPGVRDSDPDSSLPDGWAGQRGSYELSQFIPLAITLVVGLVFYAMGRKTRAQIRPKPAEAPTSSEATGVAIA